MAKMVIWNRSFRRCFLPAFSHDGDLPISDLFLPDGLARIHMKEDRRSTDDLLDFILKSVKGGKKEDYIEYDHDELGGRKEQQQF